MVLSFWLTNNKAAVIGITTINAPKIKLLKKLDNDETINLNSLLR